MDRGEVMAPKRVWLANAGGFVLLLTAVYWWLAIPERRAWQLGLSVASGLVILFAAAWLCAATFRAFSGGGARFGSGAVLRTPAVIACLLAAVVLLALFGYVEALFPKWSVWVASTITYRLRRPVKPETVLRIFHAFGWVVCWVVVPVLALPRAAAASLAGFRGLLAARPHRRFFFDYLLAFLAGVWLPALLINWTPSFDSFFVQAASFVVRFAVALALAVTAWLWTAWAAVNAVKPADS
jgi:hypothetical protein